MHTHFTSPMAVSRHLTTILLTWLILLLLMTACGGTLRVGIQRTATPDQSAIPGTRTPSPQQAEHPTPTPAAPLPGLVYRTDDGFWKTSAGGQAVRIFDRADAVGHDVPAISPDGAYILYSEKGADEADQGRSDDLWLADLSTGERRNLTGTPDRTETDFRWWPARPDVVLFSSRPQEMEPEPGATGFLAVVGVDGSGYRVLDEQNHTGGPPAPSPDGQTIAYGSGSTAWLYRWETGPEVFDPADYGLPGYWDTTIGSPAWSPDGTRLAWIVGGAFAADKSSQVGVGVFDLETRTSQVLHLHEPAFGDGWPAAPAWSPDGKWLAFTAEAQDPDEAGVWVVRADGGQEEEYQSPFTEYHLGGAHPVWSPDGSWLAFNRALPDGGTSSWVAQVGTWGLVRLDLNLPPDAHIVGWVSPAAENAHVATQVAPQTTPTPTATAPPAPSPLSRPIPDEVTLQVVGQVGGQSLSVAVEGSTAYLGVGPRLTVLDVSIPNAPRLVGQSDVLPGAVRDIVVAKGLAYVAAGDAGLRILDISDPANPHEMGSIPFDFGRNVPIEVGSTPGDAHAVTVQEGVAYVAEGSCVRETCEGSLRVVDVSDPGAPQEMAALEMPDYAENVAVTEGYAYMAHRKGLQVVDVSDPARPRQVGTLALQGNAADITIADGYAYVVSGPQVLVMDLSNPAKPQEIGSSGFIFSPNLGAVASGYLYVSDGFCEFGHCGANLRVLDVSDPTHPREIGSLSVPDIVVDVEVADGFAYVATRESGLSVVDLADAANPRAVGTFRSLGSVVNVTVSGEYAYVTSGGENGLRVLDVTDPAIPRAAGALPTLDFAGAVALADGYAYVPVWVEGLRVVDVTDPVSPREVGSLDSSDLQGTTDHVAVEGSYAYVTVQEGGLMTLDVADPSHPRLLGSYTPPEGGLRAVGVADGYAYTTGSCLEGDQRRGILHVIDVANPIRLEKVGSVELPEHSSSKVVLAGDYAYVVLADCYYSTCWGTLLVIDIANPAQPRLVSSLDVPGGAFGVRVADDDERSGRYVYLAAGVAGVWVVNVSDAVKPRLAGLANTPGRAQSVAIVDDLVYVADGEGGLLILGVVDFNMSQNCNLPLQSCDTPAIPP